MAAMHPPLLIAATIFLILLSACLPQAAPPIAIPPQQNAPTPEPSLTAEPQTEPQASSLPTPRPYRLQGGELVLAANPDDIPAIFANDALFVDTAAGDEEWQDEESVIGVFLNGEARAYPIRLLSLHEIVNDTVGGQPIAVTWCPLCYSALVFSRVVDGNQFTFGVSGYLFHNNLVMYDHQTNTLWSQVLAQGIKGAHTRQTLEVLAATQTTWGAWKIQHPDTRVLSARQMGRLSEEIVDPYVGYYTSGASGLGGQSAVDERLPAKALVVGLRIGSQKIAYPFDQIRELGLINDELEGVPVLVVYNAALNTVATYARLLEGRTLTFALAEDGNALLDEETRSVWDFELGQALAGELEGARLERLTAPIVFWFAWSDIYPETQLFGE